jgi:hypothetical protein
MNVARLSRAGRAGAAVIVIALSATGCGSSKSKTATGTVTAKSAPSSTLALTISEVGRTSTYTAPTAIKGGLVSVQLTNSGKAPHGAQLIRLEGGHTILEAFQVLKPESHKTPSWIHAEGGVGGAPPGATGTATVDLPAGRYFVVDALGASSGGPGPPAVAPLTVTPGSEGPLPSTGTTITAAAPSKDHYKWQVSGALKTGSNEITFVSKGKQTLHELSVGRITADVPVARLVKDLQSNGPPPSYVDQSVQFETSVLDSGKSENTQLILTKPGTYVFFCHLRDRDGGKSHLAEGLITTVRVQ